MDSGAGPNLIARSALPKSALDEIDSSKTIVPLQDANGRPIRSAGIVNLLVTIDNYSARVAFVVVERLATDAILGCDFMDHHVEALCPRKRVVVLLDHSVAKIYRRPAHALAKMQRKKDKDARGEKQKELLKDESKQNARAISVAKKIWLQPESETVVSVRVEDAGLFFMQPSEALYTRHRALLTNGVIEAHTNQSFAVIFANFSKSPVCLHKGQTVGYAIPYAGNVAFSVEHSEHIAVDTTTCHGASEAPTSNRPFTVEDVKLDHLDEEMQARIRDMLRRYEPMWDGTLGEIKAPPHRIQIYDGSKPVHCQPYRAGPHARKVEADLVKEMMTQGVIEPASCEWASPVLLVKKADGSLRFCVDYRKLNSITVKDTYPLPRMDECLDSLGEAQYFTTLDCNSGYWQLPVHEEDRDKTTFTCHEGTFRFVRMPFGLCNAPASFQRTVDILLSGYRWKTCLVYLDDIIIFSKDRETHLQHVDQILAVLHKNGLTLKLKKCHFFQQSVDYLGHVVRPGLLQVAEKNVEAIRLARPPRAKTQLRSFLGLCNVYRRFVEKFAHIAAPLTELTKKEYDSELPPLNEKQLQAFETLKGKLISAPILKLPKANLPFMIDTDASDYQIGCTLLQQHEDGIRYPCGYWSRSLSSAERNYSAQERECLAIVWAISTLRPYLERTRFTVYTYHESLKWLLNLTASESKGRLARWRLRLSEFDFVVTYKKGTKNNIADALSRIPTSGETNVVQSHELPVFTAEGNSIVDLDEHQECEIMLTTEEREPPVSAISIEEILREQRNDTFCQKRLAELDQGLRYSPFHINEHGVLIRKSPLDETTQVVVPLSLRPRLLHLQHVPPSAGHPGGRRMYATLRHHYYWPHMAADTYDFVKNCDKCAQERITLRRHASKLKLFPAKAPLESVAIDLMGPLPVTNRKNRYLLVMTDRYTKLTRTVPLATATAFTVAKAFCEAWVYVYGPPESLLSDNGGEFNAKFFRAVCRTLGIRNVYITSYHPQTNGQVERYNRTLKSALRKYIAEDQKDWDLFGDSITYGYNTQVHPATNHSPFELTLARPPNPLAIESLRPPVGVPPRELKQKFLQQLRRMCETATRTLDKHQRRYKHGYDKHVKARVMPEEGSYVYLRDEAMRKTNNPTDTVETEATKAKTKLRPKVTGPYKVLETFPDNNTLIILFDDDLEERVSLDRVIPAPARRHLTPHPEETLTEQEPTEETLEGHAPSNNISPPDQSIGQSNSQSDLEYPIDRIIDHGLDDDGNMLYRIRWTGYTASDDTWQEADTIARNTVVSYCKRKGLPIPPRRRTKKRPRTRAR